VFRPFRTSEAQKQRLLAAARGAPPASPNLLTVTEGLLRKPPQGFVHDVSRSDIGRGRRTFAAAREAFQRWQQFDLGWVQVVNPTASILPGELVGVEAHTAYLWSINFSRVVEVVDGPARFGFMYTTTASHIEEGQERFVIDFDPENESVSYLLEAVSRPRHILARIGYPFSRAMQHRFARDSHARIRRAVLDS
jgi:uncharacterized protein (UPF0548 family)